MAQTGKVKVSEIQKEISPDLSEIHLKWRIENFFSLPTKDGEWCDSAPIFFAGAKWVFSILPNGDSKKKSEGFVAIFLFKIAPNLPISLELTFGLITSKGEMLRKISTRNKVEIFALHRWHRGEGSLFFMPRAALLKRKSEMVPHDILTLDWTIKFPKTTVNARFAKLSNDLEVLMKSGDRSDTTVKVKGEEFRLHRNILRARNPVFNKMFENEMRENITGIVSIDDCEPGIFRLLVHFLYTGKVEKLSEENVCGLYEVADMYQEDQLKNECLHFMLHSMSVDSFSDYALVALRYDDRELFGKAARFLASNSLEIFRSDQWLSLLREYPDYANVLLINYSEAHQNSSK